MDKFLLLTYDSQNRDSLQGNPRHLLQGISAKYALGYQKYSLHVETSMTPGNNIRIGKSGRRGAEILEVALIIVPLFGMIFLLLDISMVIFLRSTFQHAVREGVRYGIT